MPNWPARMYFVLFDWNGKMFCDFVIGAERWDKLCARKPNVTIPRRRHPSLQLSWAQFAKLCEIRDHAHAQAFLTTYDDLEEVGTVSIIGCLQSL